MSKLSIESLELSLILDDFHQRRREVLNMRLDKLALTFLDYQHISIMEAKLQDLLLRSNETQAYPILLSKQPRKEGAA